MIKDASKKEEYIKKCTDLYKSYLERGITDEPLPEIHSPGEVVYGGVENGSLGFKSAKSLAEKISRDRQEEKDDEKVNKISVSDMSDLTRCTLVIESFEEAAGTIRKLAEKFKYIRGGISNKKETGSGYQGIHLKGINEKGVPFEIQIHTPETLLIKKVSDCEYIHWRHFNKNYEVDHANGDIEKIKAINEKDEAKKKYDQDCRDIYNFLYEITDNEFDRNIQDIESALGEINERFESQTDKPKPEENKEISKFADLSKFEKKGNPRELDEEKLAEALKKSSLFKEVLPSSQLGLVDSCKQVSKELYAPSVQRVSSVELEAEKKKMESESPLGVESHCERKKTPPSSQIESASEASRPGQSFGE